MRKTKVFKVSMGLLLAALAGCASVEVSRGPARGFEDAVQISATGKAPARVTIIPQWAGRIGQLQITPLNEPTLRFKENIDGKELSPQDGWMSWDGNATDLVHVDEKGNEVRQLKQLWLHPYPNVELLPTGVKLTSSANEEAALQVSKVYELRPGGGALSYEYIVRNTGDEPSRPWMVVERAVVPTGGYVLVPLDKDGPIDGGWKLREKGAEVPAGSEAETVGEFLMMKGGGKQGVGLAVRASHGWLASVQGRQVLLMTFPIVEHGVYPLYGGANVVPWIAGDIVELEPVSPQFTLSPAGSNDAAYAFRQVWYGLVIPEEIDLADPRAVGQWIQAKYDAYAEAKELPTCGRIDMQR
jgi:hypothetical protein